MFAFEFCLDVRTSAHEAGRNCRHIDVLARQLSANRIRKSGKSKLARAVGGKMRHGDFATYGGDVDNTTAALLPHQRNDLRRQVIRRPKMQVDSTCEIFVL